MNKKIPKGGSLTFHIRRDMNENDKAMKIHEKEPWHFDFNINNSFGPPYLFECDYALRHRKMSMNFLDQKAHQQKDIINAELIYTIDENTNHEFGQDSLTMFESDMKEGTESAENIISAMKQQAQTRGRDLQSYHTNQRRAGLLADYNLGRIIKEKHPTHYEGIITNLETGEKTRMGESRNDNQR